MDQEDIMDGQHAYANNEPEPELMQVVATWLAIIVGGVAFYYWVERRQARTGGAPASGVLSSAPGRQQVPVRTNLPAPTSSVSSEPNTIRSEGLPKTTSAKPATSRGWMSKSKAREESFSAGRQAALDRLQAAQETAIQEAKEKALAQEAEVRELAEKKRAEQAAEREAAEKAKREEEQKNSALMEEMKRRKQEQRLRAEANAAEATRRKEEMEKAAREERAAVFKGPFSVYAKLADGEADKRVLLDGISAASSIRQIRQAVELHTSVPIPDQTLVVNGNVLRNDSDCLVDFLKGVVSEVCVIVMRRPGSRPPPPAPPVAPPDVHPVIPDTAGDVDGLDLYD